MKTIILCQFTVYYSGKIHCLIRRSFPLPVWVCSWDAYSSKNQKNVCFLSCHSNIEALKNYINPFAAWALLCPQLIEPARSGFGWARADKATSKPLRGLTERYGAKRRWRRTFHRPAHQDIHITGGMSLGNSYFCITNRSNDSQVVLGWLKLSERPTSFGLGPKHGAGIVKQFHWWSCFEQVTGQRL